MTDSTLDSLYAAALSFDGKDDAMAGALREAARELTQARGTVALLLDILGDECEEMGEDLGELVEIPMVTH